MLPRNNRRGEGLLLCHAAGLVFDRSPADLPGRVFYPLSNPHSQNVRSCVSTAPAFVGRARTIGTPHSNWNLRQSRLNSASDAKIPLHQMHGWMPSNTPATLPCLKLLISALDAPDLMRWNRHTTVLRQDYVRHESTEKMARQLPFFNMGQFAFETVQGRPTLTIRCRVLA